jgi:hypothetical protein
MSRTPSETNTAVAFGETTTDTAHVADSTTNQYDSDVITIVRDEKNALGKHFELLPGRKVKKSSVVTVSVGRAVQRSVKSPQDLKLILEEVSEDSHAAIINAGFKDIPVGEEFFILSEAVLRDKLKTKERSNLIGVHTLAHKTLVMYRSVVASRRMSFPAPGSCWTGTSMSTRQNSMARRWHTPTGSKSSMPYSLGWHRPQLFVLHQHLPGCWTPSHRYRWVMATGIPG